MRNVNLCMPINAQMDQVHRQESAVKKRKTILLPITRWGDGISLVAKTSKTSDEGEVMKFSVGAGGGLGLNMGFLGLVGVL